MSNINNNRYIYLQNTTDTTEDDKGNEAEDQYEADMKLDHVKKPTDKEMLNEDTIVSTAMVLLVAGYDTTGRTLTLFLIYIFLEIYLVYDINLYNINLKHDLHHGNKAEMFDKDNIVSSANVLLVAG